MKTSFLSLVLASFAALSLSSCVLPIDEYPAGGYSSGYDSPRPYYTSSSSVFYDNDFSYYDGGYSPYWTQPLYGYYNVGYSYYRGSNVCPICHHSPCSGHHGRPSSYQQYSSSHRDHDHDRDDRRPSVFPFSSPHREIESHRPGLFSLPGQHRDNDDHHQSSSHSGPQLYVNTGRGNAQGEHPKEWFEQRGYQASKLQKTGHKDDDDNKKKHH